ncbi:unnamed protein product [Acanthocheilonema viteae]|uniref:Potassium channel tetramerisation-type BTB domain-containing protein n=1 Tax=Acanthocheilonema viteae TaxID=6277 RepID=A0A498SRQ4_ACAVI|nr:unnamed protein product [Acanthocheilonema viteae]
MIAGRLRGSLRNGALQQSGHNAIYLMNRQKYRDIGINRNENRILSRELNRVSVDRKNKFGWNNVKKISDDSKMDAQTALVENENTFDFHLLLNIGGSHFRIRYSTIQYRCPTSLLAEFCRETHAARVESCNGYLSDTREYFFERSGKLFEPIYDFLTTGHFHRTSDICCERLFKELDFWKIKKDFFAPCCMMMISEYENDELANGDKDSLAYGSFIKGDEFDGVCWDDQRRKLWLLMENPGTGTAAKIFALVSIIMVVVSVTGMILGSTPEWQTFNYNMSATSAKLDFRLHSTLESIELVRHDCNI